MKTSLILLTSLTLVACKPAPTPVVDLDPPTIVLPAGVKALTPAEAEAWIRQNPEGLLLDLRMPEELQREGKLPGSRHYDALQAKTLEQIGELDHQKPVLLYCALGGRSTRLAVKLHEAGFQQISLLQGGLEAWKKEGKPVVP